VCLFFSPGNCRRFLLVERESLDFECLSSRLRTRLCACSLHLRSSIFFLLFGREDLDLKGLSIRERMFDLRESLSLRSDFFPP